SSTRFPYTTLFRSSVPAAAAEGAGAHDAAGGVDPARAARVRARGGVRHGPGHMGGPRAAPHRPRGRVDLEIDGALGGLAAPRVGPGSGFPQGPQPLRGRELRRPTVREGVAEARGDPPRIVSGASDASRTVSVRAKSDS